ncbi:hypothetical protein [uncultured Tateyamaria sp.]|uniref:hypothetical protein n=1 Tax=uncultured Tateyamaria sp. TaxID=455651 RepID=UPI002616290F|nr:hypothetical protein [uncultured Tateyamaria sp.]
MAITNSYFSFELPDDLQAPERSSYGSLEAVADALAAMPPEGRSMPLMYVLVHKFSEKRCSVLCLIDKDLRNTSNAWRRTPQQCGRAKIDDALMAAPN